MNNKENEGEIKNLITQLVTAIQNSLSNSNSLKDAIDSLRQKGYSAEMLMILSINLSRLENKTNKGNLNEIKFHLTQRDIDFLKSIGIKTEDQETN